MDKETYAAKFTMEDAVGWQAIDDALEKVYGEIEPRHYGPLCGIHHAAGGSDPIDGASIYDASAQSPHQHIISYGMSELYYDTEKAGGEFSKWGFEFTMRIAPFEGDETDPMWAVQMMNNLARYVNNSGRWFEENQYIPAGGPIRLNTDSEITGLIFTPDPELGTIQTPHGSLTFLQMVGITDQELEALKANSSTEAVKTLIEKLRQENPLLITDLTRKS